MKCSACKSRISEPILIGGVEVELCESCQPKPVAMKRKDAPHDDYDLEYA